MNITLIFRSLGTLLVLLTMNISVRAQYATFDEEILEGRELHDKGAEGDAQAVLDAIDHFTKMLEIDPKNELARVYLGSAYTVRSRDVGVGPQKLETLKKGGSIMEEATANAPNDIRVRLVRGVNYLKLPAIFGKREQGRQDLIAILEAVQSVSSPQVDSLSVEEKQAVYYFGGIAHAQNRNRAEAKSALETALTLAPGSALAPEIRKELR